jgi:putative SOS response-associated peptidase YedK
MCGRFRQRRSQKQLGERFQAEGEVEVVPRFNIAPTQPVVTVNIPRWQWRMRFGLLEQIVSGPRIPNRGGQSGNCAARLDVRANRITNGYFAATFPALENAWLRPGHPDL